MTLVWLSPGLPADRAELAAALPSDISLFSLPSLETDASLDDRAAIDGLPVGSLCVATVFETDLLNQLGRRPEGVRLLVVGPPDPPSELPPPPIGRQPDAVSAAGSMSELAAAISHAAAGTMPRAALAAASATSAPGRSGLRSKLVAAGAVLAGLAIGGIVIGVTEGSSSANASSPGNGRFGQFPGGQIPGGQLPGGGQIPGGGQLPGGPQTGGQFDRRAIEQQILTCLRAKGFTGSADQLRLRAADPALRQAVATCVQQLADPSSKLPGRP